MDHQERGEHPHGVQADVRGPGEALPDLLDRLRKFRVKDNAAHENDSREQIGQAERARGELPGSARDRHEVDEKDVADETTIRQRPQGPAAERGQAASAFTGRRSIWPFGA